MKLFCIYPVTHTDTPTHSSSHKSLFHKPFPLKTLHPPTSVFLSCIFWSIRTDYQSIKLDISSGNLYQHSKYWVNFSFSVFANSLEWDFWGKSILHETIFSYFPVWCHPLDWKFSKRACDVMHHHAYLVQFQHLTWVQ